MPCPAGPHGESVGRQREWGNIWTRAFTVVSTGTDKAGWAGLGLASLNHISGLQGWWLSLIGCRWPCGEYSRWPAALSAGAVDSGLVGLHWKACLLASCYLWELATLRGSPSRSSKSPKCQSIRRQKIKDGDSGSEETKSLYYTWHFSVSLRLFWNSKNKRNDL